MDPCQFVRFIIGNLALRVPADMRKNVKLCQCKIKLKGFPTQFSTVPVISLENDAIERRIQASYSFSKSDFHNLAEKMTRKRTLPALEIKIYIGNNNVQSNSGGGGGGCVAGPKTTGKLLGNVLIPLDLKAVEKGVGNNKNCVIENGWVAVNGTSDQSELHLNVRAQPDPRFVFEFDAKPECSPQVFQVNGNNVKQSVFTCKFGFRSCIERNLGSRSLSRQATRRRGCFSIRNREASVKERKGWSLTIHDLSGSPVATLSMVKPFVASGGSNHVMKSNPGAWLILRPDNGTWKPWGRLEAWREGVSGGNDRLGYRFEHIPDGSNDSITLVNSSICAKTGGKFSIDVSTGPTPLTSPHSSFDLSFGSYSGSDFSSAASGSGSWARLLYKGFVMSSTVEADGKYKGKPLVEVGVKHVTCAEDAAAFVALAAAMNLSMDACRLFSKKLRKELRRPTSSE